MNAVISRLFLIGGRSNFCDKDFLALAGGKDANIVILPHASSEPVEAAFSLLESLNGLGARHVRVVWNGEKLLLDGVDAVYMTGGDQSDLIDRLGTEGVAEMRRAFGRGVLVAGTSAGAACIGELMISGGMRNGTSDPSTLTTRSGMGLVSGIVVDTHFGERKRFARPGAAMNHGLDKGYGALTGVGLDEDSAVLIEFRKGESKPLCRSYGKGQIWVYEPRGRFVRTLKRPRKRTVRGIDQFQYTKGASFNLQRAQV